MKRQLISFRINLILGSISIVILIFSLTVIYLSTQINSATKKVVQYDLPEALNTLAMLEELGDMNSNLLEYLLGEEEEEQEYFGNYDEFIRFRNLIPKDVNENNAIERVVRLVEGHRKKAISQVFGVYFPDKERRAVNQIDDLIKNVGAPLEALLNQMKDEEIADVSSSSNLKDVIEDDFPGLRYYLELTDETGDMLADLNRFALADTGAIRSFFANALQFERYLVRLKPLEKKPQEILRINEIERLFNKLKEGGGIIFTQYQAQNKILATKAIDDLEHQTFNVAEEILDRLSGQARQATKTSMDALSTISSNISVVLLLSTFLIISLVISMIIHIRRKIFTPLTQVTNTISKLRRGDRNIDVYSYSRNDELTDILSSLALFQIELIELDKLRKNEQEIKVELLVERDYATQAFKKLQETQSQLLANEKMASLGSLVAGVSHEVNTPLGVSVTMASTITSNLTQFLAEVNTGILNRSKLEEFERESLRSLALLESSLQHAAQLINSFKQVATDQTSSQRRKFNLLTTLNEITQTLQHKIKRTNIKYTVDGPEDIVLDGFPGPLGQVITNLFNNAILHGFEGGNDGEIKIRFNLLGDEVRLLFSDNGLGVTAENLSKLFDPFYTTKLGEGGSGLGLNIVHNIITSWMGGEIRVESRIGLTFEIKLPLIAPSPRKSQHE
jgi:signal transduction histidine kinase